jgi:hypothetical protein
VQQARAVARRGRWLERIKPAPPQPPPAALVKPIAAGGKVVADDRSRTARLLAQSCGDAVAVDMESHGFLHGAYANEGVSALVVRGVSDLLAGKDEDSDRQWQPIAARHAAAFAFELLADLEPAPHPGAGPARPGISEVPGGESVKAGSAAHHGSSDIKTEANVHRAARTVILILLGLGVAAAFAIAALSTWPVLVKLGLGLPTCVLAVLFVRLLREPEQRRWSRPAVIAATVFGLYLAVIPLADLITSRSNLPGCGDVGIALSRERHAYYQLFQDAYDRAGGRQVLGCTRRDPWNGRVHPWGAGVSQDFEGRNGYLARLMLLPEYGRVVVMQGGLNRGYTLRYGPDTGPKIGYPIQDPQPCGKGKIVHLGRVSKAGGFHEMLGVWDGET